ncbi:MAG: hypothetical protein FD147_209 [Chloroflexi bacterium]|nr:MAG: hypothetical protein FD147_209 [Chloroflexota bacterium]
MKKLTTHLLNQYRVKTYRLAPEKRLRTPQEAVQFVNERGFIFFWPVKNITLPSLWSAVAGDRPVPDEHDDPGHITWSWKDQMLDKRVWYYARILKKRNTIIALDIMPYFYALSPNYGSPEEDLLDQYHQGLLPLEAKLIFETLLDKGPLDTISLRRESHLSGTNSTSRFTRALDLLQKDLKVLPTAIAETGAWRYAFVYDLTHRYYPDLLEQARMITESDACSHLVTRLINSVGIASLKEITSLFGWTTEATQKAVNRLLDAKSVIEKVYLENNGEPVFCALELASSIPV